MSAIRRSVVLDAETDLVVEEAARDAGVSFSAAVRLAVRSAMDNGRLRIGVKNGMEAAGVSGGRKLKAGKPGDSE